MENETRPEKFLIHLDMGDVLDQDQLDQLTRQLRSEILDQPVQTAELVSGDKLPEGAKGAEAITWGALAIEVLPTFLPSVVEFLKSWTMREKSRKVKIHTQVGDKSVDLEYSSTGIKSDELNELVSILTAGLQEKPAESEEAAEVSPPEEELPDEPSGVAAEEDVSPSVDQPEDEKAEDNSHENQVDEDPKDET